VSVREGSSLARFYDILDDFEPGDPIAHLADDLQIDMMFPELGDEIPPQRFDGGKVDFEQFMGNVQGRGGRFRRSGDLRRHNIDTLVIEDGVELMVGRGLGGRRNGTIMAAAQGNEIGRLRRYAFAMSSFVELSPPSDRVSHGAPGLIVGFFDRLDGISMEEPLEMLAEDFRYEMVFPGLEGPPDDRHRGDKAHFADFLAELHSRNPRRPVTPEQRRHHVRTQVAADGLDIVLGKAMNGRRNGTVMAIAEPDSDGRIRRYFAAMAPAVTFEDE